MDADGVRRTDVNHNGAHACEAMLVDAEVLDACIHDATCANCGSGWCLSDVRPARCPASPSKTLRWVGGVLPEPGNVHVTCGETRRPR
jgi:hypothetical protein